MTRAPPRQQLNITAGTACSKKSRQADSAHRQRKGHNVCSRPAGTDVTSLLLTIAGKAPQVSNQLDLAPVQVPDSGPGTPAPLRNWKSQHRQDRYVCRQMPYEPSTELGRQVCASASGDASGWMSTTLLQSPPNKYTRIARPQSAPAGCKQLLPSSRPASAASQSSVFVGGFPSIVKVDYEKLRRKFQKDASRASLETSDSPATNTVDKDVVAANPKPYRPLLPHGILNEVVSFDRRPLQKLHEESSKALPETEQAAWAKSAIEQGATNVRPRPHSAASCRVSPTIPMGEATKEGPSKQRRPQSAVTASRVGFGGAQTAPSQGMDHKIKSASGRFVVDPDYIWSFLNPQHELKDARFGRKTMHSSAKSMAMY